LDAPGRVATPQLPPPPHLCGPLTPRSISRSPYFVGTSLVSHTKAYSHGMPCLHCRSVPEHSRPSLARDGTHKRLWWLMTTRGCVSVTWPRCAPVASTLCTALGSSAVVSRSVRLPACPELWAAAENRADCLRVCGGIFAHMSMWSRPVPPVTQSPPPPSFVWGMCSPVTDASGMHGLTARGTLVVVGSCVCWHVCTCACNVPGQHTSVKSDIFPSLSLLIYLHVPQPLTD
jgi:hypothetical protein